MDYLFYLLDYVLTCAICILFLCWGYYLLKAIKYRKSSCESYEASIKLFKEKTFNNKNLYTSEYSVDNIGHYGEIKTDENYNIGDKIEIFYKKSKQSDSITKKNKRKLPGKIIGFFIAWIICNVLFVLSVYGQYLYLS